MIDREIERLSAQTELNYVDAKKLETLTKIREIILSRPKESIPDELNEYTDAEVLKTLKKKNVKKKTINKKRSIKVSVD